MFEGQINIDIYDITTEKFYRENKSFSLGFQPKMGMKIDTGTDDYVLSDVDWSLEYSTFTAWIYLVNTERTLTYQDHLEPGGWAVEQFDPVEGYLDKFIPTYDFPSEKIITCDECKGSGNGGKGQSFLGEVDIVCPRCSGLGKIKKRW
ncbi:MAG: hypothetical protein QM484_08675 [Woeseiaceae bacterium]